MTTRRLFIAILFLALFVMATREISDPDFWWHLRTGQFIFETFSIPRTDIFSHTNLGKPWVTHEWLAKEWRINPDGDSFYFDKGWLRETAVGSGTFQHQNKPGMAPLDEVRHGSKAGQIWKRPV